jgi:hypothetical protein
MSNVANLKRNNVTVKITTPYIRYEIFVNKDNESIFESELLDKVSWTWCTKDEVTIV